MTPATSLYFAWRDGGLTPGYWWGFGLASLLLAVVTVVRLTALELIIDRAHVVAAGLLFVCVILGAVVNAYRASDPGAKTPNLGRRLSQVASAVVRSGNRYVTYAGVTVVVSLAVGAMWWLKFISLFWLEATIGVLFGAFWVVQTVGFEPARSRSPVAPPE